MAIKKDRTPAFQLPAGFTDNDELRDELLGPIGTADRDLHEAELRLELASEYIKAYRKRSQLTQGELGALVGVQKAYISKLEKNASNLSLGLLLKIFTTLKVKVKLELDLPAVPANELEHA